MGLAEFERDFGGATSKGAAAMERDFAAPAAPAASTGLTDAERREWVFALPGTPEGAKVRERIAGRHGGLGAVEREIDPTAHWIGKHLVPLLPYGLLAAIPGAGPAVVVGRLAAAGVIGGATQPDAPVRGAVTGVLGQAVGGELAGRVLAALGTRVGSGAFRRLSDEIATDLMARAKALVPAWRALPEGQAGIRALVEGEGTKRLEAGQAGPRIGRLTEAVAKEGRDFIDALRSLKALDPKTGRLDPEALVMNASKTVGVDNPRTVWERTLGARVAPRARQAIETAVTRARGPSGEAPGTGTVPVPVLRTYGHHAGASEHLPLVPYTTGVAPDATRRAIRAGAPIAGGALMQSTGLPGLGAELLDPSSWWQTLAP